MSAQETIRECLARKGGDCHTIGPDETAYEAVRRMDEANVGALMVVEGGRLLGVISERDYARKVILKERAPRETPVRAIMSRRVVRIRPTQSAADAAALMMKHGVRHLPVVERGHLIGVLSIRDVLGASDMMASLMARLGTPSPRPQA